MSECVIDPFRHSLIPSFRHSLIHTLTHSPRTEKRPAYRCSPADRASIALRIVRNEVRGDALSSPVVQPLNLLYVLSGLRDFCKLLTVSEVLTVERFSNGCRPTPRPSEDTAAYR